LNDIKDGLNYTFSNPVLRKLLVSALVVIVTFTAWGALLPTFSMDVLGGDASALGFLTLATGAGALIGSLVVVYAGPRFEHGKLSVGLVVLLALSVTGFALSQSLLLSLLFALLAGVFQTAYMVINMTLTQLAANEQFRGRVISIRFLVVGLQPIGALSLGIAAEYAGPQVALGGLVAVGLLAFFTLPHFLPRLLQRKSSIAGRQPLAL
jgi:Na+/melibiose symporter-like transporter